MIEPLTALLGAAAILGCAWFLFQPGSGYFWRWRQARRLTERVLTEDLLKHIYNCEYQQQIATVESLSGSLGIQPARASDLLVRAGVRGLTVSDGGSVRLTTQGRDYALRILRVHRLWEHYLAEETGVAAADWHSEAERREHDMSSEDVERLDRKMGYPVYDPHGDPIPTGAGDIAPKRGTHLTEHPVGVSAVIVHIEDEPAPVYAQLAAEGLHVGMRIELIEVLPQRVRFWADGEEHVLAPLLADHISVAAVSDGAEAEASDELLSGLKQGEIGHVVRLSGSCRGLERRRLMDLGILPGTRIEVEMRSPSGDPTAYRIRGTTIALRKEQASQVQIRVQLVE
ncbi:MAG: metal-dependent transcriptional regulator [Gemmatimonadetes bacterium]|nr:metal-dependent transcriptional regulator [Gemmatimonadota bacterium]